MPVLPRVDRESTPSIIARKLREGISSGELPQGTQLVEAELARAMRVSRGPLREAMQRLTQEGLLDSERNRGLFVVRLSGEDVRDIYFARLAAERAAAERLLATRSPAAIAVLRDRLADMSAASGEAARSAADLRFHEALVDLAASPRLSRMYASLLTETQMCLAALADSYTAVEGDRLAEHAAIVDALADGDGVAVNRLLAAHADEALGRLAPAQQL